MTEVTLPSPSKRRRARPADNRGLSCLVATLIGIVGINVCLTLGFVAYYLNYSTAALASNQTPVAPIQVLQTIVPVVVPAGGSALPTPEPSATPLPATGLVNILLMGKDERPDEAGQPTRTDTMMVLRLDFDHHTAKLLSLPRDMWVALPGLEAYGITEGRINTAYYYGEVYHAAGGGARIAMDTIALNFGIPIDHYAVVNFTSFVKIIDALGGIDIDVPTGIYDPYYPTEDYGTMTLIINPGPQHMDGTEALRYARTRHQDSDTERVKRQQLVLLAARDKALTFDALTKIPEVYGIVQSSVQTDMGLPTLLSYGLTGRSIERSSISTYVIDSSMLASWTTPGGASVLIPQRASIGPLIEQFMATP